jgi:hypothetical protein
MALGKRLMPSLLTLKITDQSKATSRNRTKRFPVPLALYIAASA